MNKTCLITIILFLTLLVSTSGCSGIEEYQGRLEVISAINDLKDDDPEVRLEAMKDFQRYLNYPELVVPALIDAIQDEDPRVKKEALRNLISFKYWLKIKDMLPIIMEILKDPDEAPDIKSFSAYLLGEIGFDANDVDPIVIDLLLDQLKDEDPIHRSGAAGALISITSNDRAIQPLTEALYDEDPYVRGRAAFALGKNGQGAEHAIPRIIELLNDDDIVTRSNATSALERYGPIAEDALPAIADAIVEDRIEIYEGSYAIGSIAKSEDAVEMVIGWSDESEDKELRIAASEALGFLVSAPGVVDALLHALSDSDAAVRCNAAESLGKTKPVPHVIDALINALDDEDLYVIRATATSLGGFGTAASKAIPKLKEIRENIYSQFTVQNEDGSFQYSDDYDAFAVSTTKDAASDAIDKIEGSGE